MKKLICILCALMMLLTGAVGVMAEGDVIVVGTNPEFPPFEFVGDDGTIQGFDAELVALIAAEMGKSVQIESMDFDALIPAMQSGKIDMIIAGMTIREDLLRSVLFSDPYFSATQSIIVKKDSETVKGAADLDGKKIGVQMGTTGDLYCTDEFPNATVERYTKGMDAVMDLNKGALDAVVIDQEPAKSYVSISEDLVVLPDVLSDEQYGIAIPLDQVELHAAVNAALQTLIENGKYAELYAKYFE